MRINANIMAVNTQRQLFGSQTAGAKSMEKLSSGFRINRAADDAAGLAISEKMRSQVRGLRQASRNAQDGISVMQTAEGALDEIHSMLQRMKELAVQSGSDSNQSLVDREAMQLEVNALSEEIDSVTEKTQFNKMTLLDGTFKDKHFHVGANADQTIRIDIEAMTVEGLGLTTEGKSDVQGSGGAKSTNSGAFFAATAGQDIKVAVDGTAVTHKLKQSHAATATGAEALAKELNSDSEIQKLGKFSVDGANLKFTALKDGAKKVTIHNNAAAATPPEVMATKTVGTEATTTAAVRSTAAVTVVATKMFAVKIDGVEYKSAGVGAADLTGAALVTFLNNDATLRNAGKFELEDTDKLKFIAKSPQAKVIEMENDGAAVAATKFDASSTGGKKDVVWRGIDVLSRETANKGMTKVQEAIETLASRRAEIGAIQNRIEHTIKNLDNSHENIMAAESRIRHVDMAKEIIENTRQNILQQAATSMLAQANQAPQTVLQLLR